MILPSTSREFYSSVEPLCFARLRESLNPVTGLFDRQLRNALWTRTGGTEDLTSTAISLVGLGRAGVSPYSLGLDSTRTLDALVKSARRRRYYGAIGLVIWANAVWDGIPLIGLLGRLDIPSDDLTRSLRSISTSEVAWFLSGLAQESSRAPGGLVAKALGDTVVTLLERYEERTCLFYHAAPDGPLPERMRRHIGNFADQIYSIQALSFSAIASGNDQGMEAANQCAIRVISLQGKLGQWWWHYNVDDGRTAQRYPVYSVHQYGMAPMALMTLAAAGGMEFIEAISLGLTWVSRNELEVNLIDREAGTIWRDIEYDEGRLARLIRRIRCVSQKKLFRNEGNRSKLRVNYETRPYEWAWCLYAGALTRAKKSNLHLV